MMTGPCSFAIEYVRVCLIAANSVCRVEQELEVLQEAVNLLEWTAAPVLVVSGFTDPSV